MMMKKNNYKVGTQNGFTLVELLVAVTIGLILTAVLIQSFLATRQTYQLSQGVGRMQEDIRFASHFLADHVRRAGNLGCIKHLRTRLNNERSINFTSPIIGWDYMGTGSSVSNYTIPTAIDVAADTGTERDNWLADGSNVKGNRSNNSDLLGFFTDTKTGLIHGSDVLVVNSIIETDVMLDTEYAADTPLFRTLSDHGFPDRQIVVIGDCFVADIFMNSTPLLDGLESLDAGGGHPSNRDALETASFAHTWGPTTKIYKVDSAAYYVGLGVSGSPSLYRFPLGSGSLGGESTPVELVENVETFQVLYGIDTDSDGLSNRYLSANLIDGDEWPNVVVIKIGMIVRSSSNIRDDQIADQFELLDHLTVTPETPADGFLRYAVNLTLKPRNTGEARDYQVSEVGTSVEYQIREPLVP